MSTPYFYGQWRKVSKDLEEFAPKGLGSSHAATKTHDARIRELEIRLARAMLTCEAMWSMLQQRLSLTDADLIRRINELDLSDGKMDGSVRKDALACPGCHVPVSAWLAKCPSCGGELAFDPFA